jgi:tetratricopeptide (TPR) repeat protein
MTPSAMLRHISLTPNYFFVLLLCLSLLLLTPAKSEAASTRYAIVLASAPGKNLNWTTPEKPLFAGRTIYTESVIIKGTPWERQCLGFFDNRQQAASLLKDIQRSYPGAWIQQVSAKTSTTTVSSAAKLPPVTPATSKTVASSNTTSLSEEQLDSLMQRARSDITAKNYASAIRYLTALTATGDNKYAREALELLGLARQRNNQITHAVATYEKYLVLYPDGEDSDRVRQRLAGLLTAASSPRNKINQATADEDFNEVTTYGSLSQYYINNRTNIDGIGNETTVSQLTTFLDLTTVQKTKNFDHRYQINADYIKDFINDADNSEFRFFEAYYEFTHRKTGTSGRIGRQVLRLGATRKRFDGISAGYQINPEMRFNVLAGYPVDLDNYTSVNTDKTFYGATFETGTFLDHWDMNLFYFDQQVGGLTDSNSIGSEVRYNDKTASLFGMIDYDLFYDEINTLQFNANLLFDHGRTAFMNAFKRKSPALATSNALIGRTESSIDELKQTLNIEQIYQLARDRTANSQTITVGGSQPLSENLQSSADITVAGVDGTVASGGVAATPDFGPDYILSAQLVVSNFFVKRDINVLGIRYYDADTARTTSLIANTRYPITPQWRINPRLQYDIRNFSTGGSQKKLRAFFKTDYLYLSRVRFDFEVGYEDNAGDSLGNNNLFFNLGYRWDF